MMPRRKYRAFILCTVVILFMLYRVAQNSWEEPAGYTNLQPPPFPLDHHDADTDLNAQRPEALPEGQEPPSVAVEDFAKVEVPDLKEQEEPPEVDKLAIEKEEEEKAQLPQADSESPKKQPQVNPEAAGSKPANAKPTEKVHWVKQPEKFPVAEDKIAKLPSGSPKTIPKIQFEFQPESEEAKTKRETRLQNITAEIGRSWGAYRKYAWMHDELSPVSGDSRDPFCGWAATLVDSLDTLWIAGFKKEFDEAAKAVADIDFTWSEKREIPVFETTIRYLGGLLAAYDVSGGAKGEYGVLLEKATELAEVLMGVFDTPNRMPILYYKWEPEFASQPHRASVVGIAELGTLSMEFTRLAQLSGADKYYDAIDRITDALIEMQAAKKTVIPGIFPQNIDASGCRRVSKPDPKSMSGAAQAQLVSSEGKGEPMGWTEDGDIITLAGHAPLDEESEPAPEQDPRLQKRATEDDPVKVEAVQPQGRPPFGASGEGVDWDCQAQGLIASDYWYSMGGSQDSAYEYFPKEWLLLGGLEPKYQKLHENTVKAVDEWLTYRPMIPDSDNWDILFTAKTMAWDKPTNAQPQYEMTHLACFIGGMYGLGAKIFGRDQDLETAKQLTDGCVWAYQMTPSGIMPEAAMLLPCPTTEKCEFNQTFWEQELDPNSDWRTEQVAKWDEKQEKQRLAQLQAASAGDDEAAQALEKTAEDLKKEEADMWRQKALEAEKMPTDVPVAADTIAEAPKPADENPSGTLGEMPAGAHAKRAAIPPQEAAGEAQLPESLKEQLEPKAADAAPPAEAPVPHAEHVEGEAANSIPELNVPQKAVPDKARPLTHEEYVKDRIESEGMKPGVVEIMARNYILRPEAIESVWYMYRITGDPSWQEKGWTMYEAVMRATRTDLANSALEDVMSSVPELKNEMESFWLAETLKYYYLLFAEPDVISLDEWVLNTEAHPFRRPT